MARSSREPEIMISTTNDVAGHRVVSHRGIARGVTVRSRSVVGNWFGGVQAAFGGRVGVYVKLAEQTRAEAHAMMCAQARDLGANAIVGMRYDANEITDGVTEVMAYGTAVVVRPDATA